MLRHLKDEAGEQEVNDHGQVVFWMEKINSLGVLTGLIFMLSCALPFVIYFSLHQCLACADFKVHVHVSKLVDTLV